jgi:peroxiredoxin
MAALRIFPSILVALSFSLAASAGGEQADAEWTPREGLELIGTPAPAWNPEKTWFNSEPLSLEDLRGRVVLVRFWVIECPLCENTAPALNALYRKYRESGLEIIGFHHPKSKRSRSPRVVKRYTKAYGFRFPVALDGDWEVLRKFWLSRGKDRTFTSASFLIDRKGIIRWLHDGGEYHRQGGEGHERCAAVYQSLETAIEKLLAEGGHLRAAREPASARSL